MSKRLDLVIGFFVLLMLVGMMPHPVNALPLRGGTFIVAIPSNPPHLNPAINGQYSVHEPAGQIYNALLKYDFNLNPQPELAQSWEVSSDAKTFTFHLVRNATWHDGKPLTSADVQFTWDKITRVAQTAFKAVNSIETPDDYTVVVRMSKPAPYFLSFVDFYYAPVIPKHIYDGTDFANNPHNYDQPVGTGPFIFKEWVKGDHITLDRNPNYWRLGKPYMDRLVFKIIPDAVARVQALTKGEVDFIYSGYIPLNSYGDLAKNPDIYLTNPPKSGMEGFAAWYGIMFNIRNPPLNNVNVRHALIHATDRDFIFKTAGFGIGKVGYSTMTSALSFFHNPNVPRYDYDVAKANQLLDQAGYPRGADGIRFKLGMLWDTGRPEFTKYAEILREEWKQVGVDVTLKPLDTGAALDLQYMKTDFQVAVNGQAYGPDFAIGAASSLTSDRILPIAFANSAGYSNKTVDALFERAQMESDPNKKRDLLFQIQTMVVQDSPEVAFRERLEPSACRAEWVGMPAGPFGPTRARLDELYWTKGTPIPVTASITSAVTSAMTTVGQVTGQSPYLYAGLAVVAIVVIGIAYVYSRKKRS